MNEKSKPAETNEDLTNSFRANLQTAITAEQFGQSARFSALPGPKTADYCAALTERPGNELARELAAPALAILREIRESMVVFFGPLYRKSIKDPKEITKNEKILEQLDFAITLILRDFIAYAAVRARWTKCPDLLVDYVCRTLHGPEAVELIRKYQEKFPEDGCDESGKLVDGGFPEMFAWDTYQRVEALDRFADEYPEHVKCAAKLMHGWPMLAFRHTSNRNRFKQLAERLELGTKYPLDASEGARFRPDTPLVRYLDPVICRLNYVWSILTNPERKSNRSEQEDVRFWLRDYGQENPTDDEVKAAIPLKDLPALNKATAREWAEKVVVPYIMATGAADWRNCEDIALQQIAKQRGVKSQATFKSRLFSAVSATLRRLARPA